MHGVKLYCTQCGSALQGSDTLYSTSESICSGCLIRNQDKAQKEHIAKECRELYALAERKKLEGAEKFNYGICWYKFCEGGFYHYFIEHGVEHIVKKYSLTIKEGK